jgi:pimeloyl-ACP methyl ester carboxylesterase
MITVRGLEHASAEQPSPFNFITVEQTRLRYLDKGSGDPVVLLHGNGSMIEDFLASGIFEHAAPGHRLIAFDRPGFGYSERPRGRSWGPAEQARLLLRTLADLQAERPIVVGHSWGALVALAMALQGPDAVAGLVLMSGYYYPARRNDTMSVPPFPFAGEALGHALRRMMAPDTLRRVFAPRGVPERFSRAYPLRLAMRPSQMRAVDEEAGILRMAARALSPFYGDVRVPVHLIAGSDDRIVDTDQHSARLHRELAASTFLRVPYCGHMVHHAVPEQVAAAVAEIGATRRLRAAARRLPATGSPGRQWLHIGDGRVAA